MPKEKKPGIIERNKGKLGSAALTGAMYGGDALELLKFFFKDGGRVRGVGKATHGHGKAMKKQGKK